MEHCRVACATAFAAVWGDLSGDGSTDVTDAQFAVNAVLGGVTKGGGSSHRRWELRWRSGEPSAGIMRRDGLGRCS